MTYSRFHFIFTLPLLALLAAVSALAAPGVWQQGSLLAGGLVLLAVMVFTTPWDNYAAACGIWGFPRGRYLFRIGWLPVEEYAFFLIQSLIVMLFCGLLAAWLPARESLREVRLDDPLTLSACAVVALAWLVCGITLRRLPRLVRPLHYCWHLLFWFGPLIALEWVLAWPILAPRWDILAAATIVIGGYLSWADWMAIQRGIWFFDHGQTTGRNVAPGMPWEEAAFFLLTSLLVAQSYLMLLPEGLR